MMCGLHINQRRKGSLCCSSECTGCLPFRKPAEPLMGFTPPVGSVQLAPGKWYDSRTGTEFTVQPTPTYAEPTTQLDREVTANRALYAERRVMLAGMAMQGDMADGGVTFDQIEDRSALWVGAADALLTALALTKPPTGSV